MKKPVLMLTVLIFYILIHASASNAGWIQIRDATFFDPSNIEYTQHDTIFVWLKDTLSKSDIYKFQLEANDYYNQHDKRLYSSFYGYNNYNYHNYADYSFSIQYFEYDCKNKLTRLILEYEYDKYNRVINRTYDLKAEFKSVFRNLKNEYIFSTVCNFAKNNSDKSGLYQQHHSLPEVPALKINKDSQLWSTTPDQ